MAEKVPKTAKKKMERASAKTKGATRTSEIAKKEGERGPNRKKEVEKSTKRQYDKKTG